MVAVRIEIKDCLVQDWLKLFVRLSSSELWKQLCESEADGQYHESYVTHLPHVKFSKMETSMAHAETMVGKTRHPHSKWAPLISFDCFCIIFMENTRAGIPWKPSKYEGKRTSDEKLRLKFRLKFFVPCHGSPMANISTVFRTCLEAISDESCTLPKQ